MALLLQKVEEKRLREEKVKELTNNPHKDTSKEAIRELDEFVPKYLLDREELGEIPSDFTMEDYLSLIKKYKRLYGENFEDNLEFLKLYAPSLYGIKVFQDTVDLKKSADFNKKLNTNMKRLTGGGSMRQGRRPRK